MKRSESGRRTVFDGKLALTKRTDLTFAETDTHYKAFRNRNRNRLSQGTGSHWGTYAVLLSRTRALSRHADSPKSWRT